MSHPLTSTGEAADTMTPDFWKGQIKASQDKRAPYVEGWKGNIQRYLAKTLSSAPTDHTIVVPLDFANVEQKKAQLFFRVPELQLAAKRPEYEGVAPVFQSVINHMLGRHGVDAKTMMDEVLFDALCPSGLAVTKIGYEPTIAGVKPFLDPVTQQPVLNAAGAPEMVPNVIHEEYYWNRISPEKALIPADFHGSDYHKAPWLGFEFEMDFAVAQRRFALPPDFNSTAAPHVAGLNENEQPQAEGQRKRVTGQEIWYRCALIDPAEPHPHRLGKLVLIDGLDGFAEPPGPTNWQRVDPQTGALIGIRRFPIHIKAVRYVSDSAYPPSDVTMARPQVEELSKGRTQMIQQRERAIPMRWANMTGVDGSTLTKGDVEKILKGQWQGVIPLNGNGNELLGEIAAPKYPRENFEFDRIAKQDLQAVWAMGANQRGEDDDTSRTATEASIIQAASQTRLAYEQDAWLDWFVEGAEILGGLIQVFADEEDFVPITGPDGVVKLVAWDRTKVAGEYVFTAKPDTAIRQDAGAARRRVKEIFEFQSNNPHINKLELTKWYAREQNLPESLVQPQPPEAPPEKPKFSFSFTGEDFSPLAPQAPIVAAILAKHGIEIPLHAVEAAADIATGMSRGALTPGTPTPPTDQPHPGTATPTPPLSKHHADLTGNLPGSGKAASVQ